MLRMQYLRVMHKLFIFISALFIGVSASAQIEVVKQLSSQVNEDSLITYVKQLTGLLPADLPTGPQVITSRFTGEVGNTQTSEFIKHKLTQWGVPFEEIKFSATGNNIIAKIEGRRTDKVLMIGAHFDAVRFSPGADDNASGTAAVMEMARLCAGKQFPVTLHLAFWDEEEQFLTGSRATAPAYGSELIAYLNHDMIAYDSNNDSSFDIHTRPIANSIALANVVYNCIDLYDVPLKPRIINPGETATDHGSFWELNRTAVAINEEYAFQDDFNPHWHQRTDSLTYFNTSYFVRLSRFGFTAFLHLAHDTSPILSVYEKKYHEPVMQVYPNPFHQSLQLQLAHLPKGIFEITLFDVHGNKVLYEETTDTYHAIETAHLPAGLYYLQVANQSEVLLKQKLIKQ